MRNTVSTYSLNEPDQKRITYTSSVAGIRLSNKSITILYSISLHADPNFCIISLLILAQPLHASSRRRLIRHGLGFFASFL